MTRKKVLGFAASLAILGAISGLVWLAVQRPASSPPAAAPQSAPPPQKQAMTPQQRLEAKAERALRSIKLEIEEFAAARRIPLARISSRRGYVLEVTFSPADAAELRKAISPIAWQLAEGSATLRYLEHMDRGGMSYEITDRHIYHAWAFDTADDLCREFQPKWKREVPGGVMIVGNRSTSFGCRDYY
mgnify:CR=1 FL=1